MKLSNTMKLYYIIFFMKLFLILEQINHWTFHILEKKNQWILVFGMIKSLDNFFKTNKSLDFSEPVK